MFRRRHKTDDDNAPVTLQEVKTILNDSKGVSDTNKDGVPDYLQRPEIISIINSNKDLNQWESSVEKELEEWLMGLRGYKFQVKSKTYIPISPPIVNETGLTAIRTHLKSIIHKHSINTNLREEDVHTICREHSLTFIEQLRDNVSIYSISLSDLKPIVNQVDNFIFLVLSRSIGDAQRQHTTNRTRLTGVVGQNNPTL